MGGSGSGLGASLQGSLLRSSHRAEAPTLPLCSSVALDMSFYFLEPVSTPVKWAE